MADLIKIFGKGFLTGMQNLKNQDLSGFSRFLEALNSNLNPAIKNFPVQNGRFNMGDQNFEIPSIYVKFNFLRFLRSLNLNITLKL